MKTPLAGFRFSAIDGVILAVGIFASWILRSREFPLWWIVPFAVGHFFLFCNVFRIRRAFELVWAAAFIVNVCFWLLQLSTEWLPPLLTQSPVTVCVLAAEICSPRYHGVLAHRFNSRLPGYLEQRMKTIP